MVLAHPRLQVNVAKQRPRFPVRSTQPRLPKPSSRVNHDKIKPASDFFNNLLGGTVVFVLVL